MFFTLIYTFVISKYHTINQLRGINGTQRNRSTRLRYLLFVTFTLGTAPTFAHHSDDPSGVALVGSLQSELGCASDWQPDCSESELIQNGDLWQSTFSVPAGTWEYKVALNDNWDEDYGDSGNNINLFLHEETAVTFTYNHTSHAVSDDAPVIVVQPISATIVGSLQNEIGCPGDWQPDCIGTHMNLDDTDLIWQATFALPAGDWEYKTALNDTWDENYGENAAPNGANIGLSLDAPRDITFYYDHASHWITDNQNAAIATLAGSFQSQLGCPGDWQPDCLRSWLKDIDGDGVYQFTTTDLVAGSYEVKVAHNESWDENYGQNGQANGANIQFNVTADNEPVVFSYTLATHILTVGSSAFDASLRDAKAYWLTENAIAWDVAASHATENHTVELHYSIDANLVITPNGLEGGEIVSLQRDGVVDGASAEKFRHLAGLPVYTIAEEDLYHVADILKSQFAVFAKDRNGEPVAATGIQPAGVLDALYANNEALGLSFKGDTPSVSLWAPTAQSVKFHLFDDSSETSTAQVFDMTLNPETGIWTVRGDTSWQNKYYLFEVDVYARSTGNIENNLVTDPYSLSLSMNSQRSHIVNMNSRELKPHGWDRLRKPKLKAPEDQVIYELHVRDFSISDSKVNDTLKGKFSAFTQWRSHGMKHLRRLAWHGLSTVHLLPAFDCATINEDPSEQLSAGDLSEFSPDSEEQQAAIEAIRGQDAFNWCYDPYHYTVPEGSYSTDPDGSTRIKEFRSMVAALNRSGLRVVMDVVYNHTSGSLQGDTSVLDKIVPDYYHRLNNTGGIEMSSCCANTATEHAMMEKLMLDSLKTWATEYKVDGFRFDLMGHHTKDNILKAKNMLQSLTKADDGVIGKNIYLYGEGWNFGEVANNTRFDQATQANMGDHTGVGSFNDQIRDAVRGGGPFDTGIAHVENQGFINGQYYDPNIESQDTLNDLLRNTDKIRMSLAGTLSDYQFIDHHGDLINGSHIGGYTSDPQEAINYIAAHDNETLFDVNQYKLPLSTSLADRVRVANMGNSIVAFAQGIPFYHAGQDMLRSKSTDRNSYDSGDWFNFLDFSYSDNGWGRGLPPRSDNETNWDFTQALLGNPDLTVGKDEIKSAAKHMKEILLIRRLSPLLRMKTAEEVMDGVTFHNTGPGQIPGLIVMTLSNSHGVGQFIVFNASKDEQNFTIESLVGKKFKLHPVQQFSSDPIVRKSRYDSATGSVTVPARTTAVFNAKRRHHH
ncbi:MAG: pullulanase-type alpha-1,6-glucosidase [Agarilytica sp.]